MNNLRKLSWVVSGCLRRLPTVSKSRVQIGCVRCMSTIEKPPQQRPGEVTSFSIPEGVMGQPTFHTHPHLIAPGYLTCGITQAEYMDRRDNLVTKLVAEVEKPDANHVIVIPGAVKQYMSDKIPYVFRQNSDFFYLTGCLEPNCILVMTKPVDSGVYKAVMFVNEKDKHAEQWEGPRTGCANAVKLFGVNEAMPIDTFDDYIGKITMGQPSVLWYQNNSPSNPEVHSRIRSLLSNGSHLSLGDPQRTLHFMRVIKSPAEIELMKETCYIGSQAMNLAMACTQPGVSEHNITSVLDFVCRQAGAEHLAFPPVVAGGARATHIHYITNNQMLNEKDMLLVDSGSQRWLYNSDISRTWPVSGKFGKYQRILYELVLNVQKRLIELVGEHRPPLDQLFDQMCRLLGTELQKEGILPRNIDGNELVAKAYRLCPHHVSHYLGLDVHDSPLVRRSVPVKPGMVVTVEPGIYIEADDKSVREEFRGIGIRIEDDVLITDGKPVVLTDSAVKEPQDIEALVAPHPTPSSAGVSNANILDH